MSVQDPSTTVPFLLAPFALPDPLQPLQLAQEVAESLAFEPKGILRIRAVDLEEILGGVDNTLPACFLAVGAQRSRAICRISAAGVNYKGEPGTWAGTGFMISRNILLTNHHVLNSEKVALGAMFEFNYEQDERGEFPPRRIFSADPKRLFITSKVNELDFTFVWVNGDPGDEFGCITPNRRVFGVVRGDFINIIHHPRGNPKSLTLQDNKIVARDIRVLHYTTDTEPGSSGSPLFDNRWNLVGLHHASVKRPAGSVWPAGVTALNEGLSMTAIATLLETRGQLQGEAAAAREVLATFTDVDPLLGFFGALGRVVSEEASGFETVVDAYVGEGDDVDVGFWNIEWFNKNYLDNLDEVARIIVAMNLDVWAFEETSATATAALVEHLRGRYGVEFAFAASEPDAPDSRQTTAVMWNTRTVQGEKLAWPAEIEAWLRVDSREFDEVKLEAVDGAVFPRYPARYRFQAKHRAGQDPFEFNLVPVHLKAMAEGSKRRRMASKILGAAVARMITEHGASPDWILGGDFNAPLASEDFAELTDAGLVPVSAADEANGGVSYIGRPRSLIDHVFLSENLAKIDGTTGFFIVAVDRRIPGYVDEISDHRPVLLRVSLKDHKPAVPPGGGRSLAEFSPRARR